MTKNNQIIDVKPKVQSILEKKPSNSMNSQFTDQLFAMTLGMGMLTGIPGGLTYPQAINIISSKTP